VFFERSERNFLKHADFDPFKEEDPKLIEEETLNRLRTGLPDPFEREGTD